MNVKTNIRAGKGGASGSGKNGGSSSSTSTDSVDPAPVYIPSVYVPPVSRCIGI